MRSIAIRLAMLALAVFCGSHWSAADETEAPIFKTIPFKGASCNVVETIVSTNKETGKPELSKTGDEFTGPSPGALPEVVYPGDVLKKSQDALKLSDLVVDVAQLGVAINCYKSQQTPKRVAVFIELAKRGLLHAQYIAASAYLYGAGVPQNASLGLQLMTEAAEKKYAAAQSELGVLFYEGKLVPQDVMQARALLVDAARQGIAKANKWLPLVGIDPAHIKPTVPEIVGLGFKGDRAMFEKAEVYKGDGYPGVEYALASWTLGETTDKEQLKSAIQQIEGAARAAIRDAYWKLAVAYENGVGVEQNYAESLAWYIIAADVWPPDGSRDALDRRTAIVASKLTAPERAELKNICPSRNFIDPDKK